MKKGILLSLIAICVAICACLWSLPAARATQPDRMPTALYVGIADVNLFIRNAPSADAETIGQINQGDKVYVVEYEPYWVKVVKGTEQSWVSGYVRREYVINPTSLAGAVYPYGTTPAVYTAVIAKDTMLYPEPKTGGVPLFKLTKGAKVAILSIEDGWARVIYWQQYGFFYLDAIEDLTPVFGEDLAGPGDTISAFISFYRIDHENFNDNRMHNIALACDYISVEIGAGEVFNYDEVAGPYQGVRGYREANSFYNGQTVLSYGGGCCQVSSTMYNVLLAMPKGIEVTNRRAHGKSSISYLPYGVDAASGNKDQGINLIFNNKYSFPIRLEAIAHDGVLFIALSKV